MTGRSTLTDYDEAPAPVPAKPTLADGLVAAYVKKQGKRRPEALESRLRDWAREYGGGKYVHGGGFGDSPLAALVLWRGRAPQGLSGAGHYGDASLTPADVVQQAVCALDAMDAGKIPAMVLRSEYLTPGKPIEVKLQILAKSGARMSQSRYCQHLRLGLVHVAAWLRIPFSKLDDDD